MKIIIKNVYKLILSFSFLLNTNAFSSEKANVYCYSPIVNKWEWLKDNNNNSVTSDGEWKTKRIGKYLLRYFEISSQNPEEIESFREQCIAKYGASYDIVQPATDSIFDFFWKPFGLSEQVFINGKIELRYFKNMGGRAFNNFCRLTLPYSSKQSRYLSILDILDLIGDKNC